MRVVERTVLVWSRGKWKQWQHWEIVRFVITANRSSVEDNRNLIRVPRRQQTSIQNPRIRSFSLLLFFRVGVSYLVVECPLFRSSLLSLSIVHRLWRLSANCKLRRVRYSLDFGFPRPARPKHDAATTALGRSILGCQLIFALQFSTAARPERVPLQKHDAGATALGRSILGCQLTSVFRCIRSF